MSHANNPDSTDVLTPDEAVIRDFLQEIERAADPQVVLDEFLRKYPHLADKFRELFQSLKFGPQPEPARPALGQLGRYRVVRRLQVGGMGEIYEAHDDQLDRYVAIKVVRPDKASPEAIRRFGREQKVLARLHHTHIVPIFDSGREGDLQYFVMPYIDGAPLRLIIHEAADSTTRNGRRTPTLAKLSQSARLKSADRAGHSRGYSASAASPRLSAAYYRSVAEAMRDVAQSLDQVHATAGVVHRDVKPSNIMVDGGGHAWLIDFGLASQPGTTPADGSDATLGLDDGADELTQGPLGTPQYMAPEQFDRRWGRRTDVWGLGATLYELLTLRPPFVSAEPLGGATDKFQVLAEQVKTTEPRSPSRIARGVPKDLEAICRKAMFKNEAKRYETAGALAEDLRHFLEGRPTVARKVSHLERAWMWSRRHKGAASALLVSVLSIVAIIVGLFAFREVQANAELARQQERSSYESSRTLSLVLLARREQAQPRLDGWSKRSWEHVAEATSDAARLSVQPVAIDGFSGPDAFPRKMIRDHSVVHAAWDSEGKRALLSGTKGILLWRRDTDDVETIAEPTMLPVGFAPDGALVSLRVDKDQLQLWDLGAKSRLRDIPLPEGVNLGSSCYAMAPDGTRLAAAVVDATGKPYVVVWDGESGKMMHQFEPASSPLETGSAINKSLRITALAINRSLLAAGCDNGSIVVWSLGTGKEVATLGATRNLIRCLKFARDYVRSTNPVQPDEEAFLLAAGDAGGRVVIWDVGTKMPRSYCDGGEFEVLSLDFTPDASLLVAVSRGTTRLCDVATGRPLLDIALGQVAGLVSISPDGRRLLLSRVPVPNAEPGMNESVLWDLSLGRGTQTLRGPRGQIAKVRWSRDETRVAAVSHDWTVGVWDADGRLLHVLPMPRGTFADNSAVVFNHDAKQLVTCSGARADLWDLTSGRRVRWWDLPSGIVDLLAWPDDSHLFLVRYEKEGIRIRNLLCDDPNKPLAEVPCRVPPFDAELTDDGKTLIVDGFSGSPGVKRAVRGYDLSGKQLYELPNKMTEKWGGVVLDPTQRVAGANLADGDQIALFDVATGEVLGWERSDLRCLAPRGEARIERDRERAALVLVPRGSTAPRAVFGPLERRPMSTARDAFAFTRDGRRVAWGSHDGTVCVYDLLQVQGQLTEIGLGW